MEIIGNGIGKLAILILLGFFIFTIIVVGLTISIPQILSIRKAGDKKCSFCKEMIPVGAVVCPNCKEITA